MQEQEIVSSPRGADRVWVSLRHGRSFSGVTWPVHEVRHSLHFVPRLRMSGCLHGVHKKTLYLIDTFKGGVGIDFLRWQTRVHSVDYALKLCWGNCKYHSRSNLLQTVVRARIITVDFINMPQKEETAPANEDATVHGWICCHQKLCAAHTVICGVSCCTDFLKTRLRFSCNGAGVNKWRECVSHTGVNLWSQEEKKTGNVVFLSRVRIFVSLYLFRWLYHSIHWGHIFSYCSKCRYVIECYYNYWGLLLYFEAIVYGDCAYGKLICHMSPWMSPHRNIS